MKIHGFDVGHLSNDQHFQFHTELEDLVEKKTAEALGVKEMFDRYKSLLEREDEALKKIVKSALTEQIREADKARDETFSGMCDIVRGMGKHFNPAIKAAAKRIQVVLDTYGYVASKPLTAETSAIYNLLQEFDLPKYTDDRFNTSLNPWLNELKNRNVDFEALYERRFEEEGAKTQIVLRDARAAVDEAYRTLVERINAAIIMEGGAKYESFVNTLNSMIAKYAVKKPHHRHKHPAPGDGGAGAGTNGDGYDED